MPHAGLRAHAAGAGGAAHGQLQISNAGAHAYHNDRPVKPGALHRPNGALARPLGQRRATGSRRLAVGQRESKRAALADLARDPYRAAEHAHQLAHQCQPQPNAAMITGERVAT